MTRKTLRFRPLMQTARANPSGIERVPRMPAGARPEVAFTRRPATERAPDTRAGSAAAFIESWVDYRSVGTHAPNIMADKRLYV